MKSWGPAWPYPRKGGWPLLIGLAALAGCSVDVGKLRVLARDAGPDRPQAGEDAAPDGPADEVSDAILDAAADVTGSPSDAREVVPFDSRPGDDLPVQEVSAGEDTPSLEAGPATDTDAPSGETGDVIGTGGVSGLDGATETGGASGTGGMTGIDGATETGGTNGTGGTTGTGGLTGTGGTTDTGGATGTGGTTTINLALTATAYRWAGNSTATANTYRYAAPLLNDDSVAADVNLNGTGDEYYSSRWEAAGVVLGQAASVTQVEFVNGSTAGGPYPASASGYFMANFRLQTSTDGTTWVDTTGWVLTPAYPYDSSAGDQTYTFAGLATDVLGVRVVGQIGTGMYSGSWHANAREVRVWGAAGSAGTVSRSFEAENLSYTASYGGASNNSDPCPTGTCYYVQLNDPASLGGFIEFTIPSLSAGTYGVTMYYKSNNNRGIAQGRLDGVTLAQTCDEYASTAAFLVPCSMGSSTLATSGSHTLRFTVAGRNPASSGYMITVDRIVLTPL
jgi:hypothetical protein